MPCNAALRRAYAHLALILHRQTVAKYLERGELKGRKAGKSWFITRKAIEEFLGI